jgi:MAP/microtubule affinity-regulating kinase
MDFDGTSWSNYISDIGMNALAGTLLDTPIPPSLPNTLMQITPTQLHAVERPSSTVTDVTSLAPNISEDPPSPPLESIQSNESVISSNVTHQSEDDITTNDDSNSISVSNQSSSSSSSSANQPNVTSQEDVAHPSTPFIFPDLPNKGIHEYNLFVPPSYVLGPIIGEGEFAKVRMACNLVTNGAVAIKAYRRRRGGLSSSIDEQMLREVNILKGLRCRNIVKVFETLVHGDRVFMIMEIMTKGDMRKYINKVGALKETNARKMFADVLNGIAYLHHNNIVHLDLKLENLLLNQDMVVKITDFGCARFQIGRKCFDNPCGSYAYGAPEVISGQSYDGKKADVWSLGIILYCMVSARLPYADDGKLADLMWERRRSPDIPSWVTLECCKLIRLSLRYRAERRVEILEMMTHPWMWADTRKLPWYKPTTAKMMEQFYEHF